MSHRHYGQTSSRGCLWQQLGRNPECILSKGMSALKQALTAALKDSSDVVWPVAGGAWGETGQLAADLESAGLTVVGTLSATAADASHKLRCSLSSLRICEGC